MQSKPITLNDTVARADGLLSADLDNETVLLGIAQDAYFGLTDTAQRIWQALDQPHTVADLVAMLTAHYEVDATECVSQTLQFLEQLADEGLIQVGAGQRP